MISNGYARMYASVVVRTRVTTAAFVAIIFFHAKDGIRLLVRSRGLGDVYTRQLQESVDNPNIEVQRKIIRVATRFFADIGSVSYTNLNLPTNYPV